MQGFPAAFLVTSLQQLTSFALLITLILLSQLTPWRYLPKRLTTRKECGLLILFSLCFTLNIALNNLSLTMLDVSTNQVLRSFAPLTTMMAQCVFSKITGDESEDMKPRKVALMLFRSIAGVGAVIAKGMSMGAVSSATDNFILGVAICLMSLFPAAMELILAATLGGRLELNPIDSILYMAVPSTTFLIIPMCFLPNEVNWPSYTAPLTDIAIAREVIRLSPMTFFLAIMSGALALFYNMLLYTVVQTLSASTSAFASTCNKFVTILLALVFGFEVLPAQSWLSAVMLLGIAGNLIAFTVSTWLFYFPSGSQAWLKVNELEVAQKE